MANFVFCLTCVFNALIDNEHLYPHGAETSGLDVSNDSPDEFTIIINMRSLYTTEDGSLEGEMDDEEISSGRMNDNIKTKTVPIGAMYLNNMNKDNLMDQSTYDAV